MHIIVRGNNTRGTSRGSSQYQGFTPHWNHAMDRNPVWIGTRQQYDRELKTRGLRVYDPDRKCEPPRKAYAVTKETRAVGRAIQSQTDKQGNFKPSGALKEELIKRKVIRKRSEVEQMKKAAEHNIEASKKGGFY